MTFPAELFTGQDLIATPNTAKQRINRAIKTRKILQLKKGLYSGFEEINFHDHKYNVATKAKAIFDYLYLKSDLHRR